MNTLTYDLIVMAATIPACLVYNYLLYKHPQYASKKSFTFLLVFLAMYPLLNMVAHLIAVSTYAIIRMGAGVFEYDIKFYTLIQFGVLLLLINGYLLNRIKQISRGNYTVHRQIVIACILQSAITLPLFPFNPISLVPFITSAILMLRLAYARRGRKSDKSTSQTERLERAATYA